MLFNSQVQAIGKFKATFSKEEISNEPMFYRASFDFAWDNGGNITKHFLSSMMTKGWNPDKVTIDSRVHMLMPGWYPCIPGMHHDDIPRTRSDGQPDYENPGYNAKHLIGLVNAEIAPTEFALGEIDLEIPPEGQLIYRDWHPKIMQAIADGKMESFKAKSGIMYEFDNYSFHQGTAAVSSGWRWFIRVSKDTDRALDCKNEIRKQTQVYMENPVEGW